MRTFLVSINRLLCLIRRGERKTKNASMSLHCIRDLGIGIEANAMCNSNRYVAYLTGYRFKKLSICHKHEPT